MPDTRFYKKPEGLTLAAICSLTGAKAVMPDGTDADAGMFFSDIAPLDQATVDMVSFFDNTKYLSQYCESKAGACFVREKFRERAPKGMVLLISKEPYYAFAQLTTELYPTQHKVSGISPAAHVHPSAKIGQQVSIAAGAVIGAGAEIGDYTSIGANSVIDTNVVMGEHCRIAPLCSVSHAIIGSHVVLHGGVQIGQDGFGFAPSARGVLKVPQLGRVLIGDHVDIGSNTCVDRGSGPDTIIGAHTKIDNFVQVAHNVRIGKYVFIAAHAGLAGSASVGDFVMLGGQCGVAGHVHVGDGSKVVAQSGVMHDLAGNANYGGSPALPAREWHRQTVTLSKLAAKTKNEQDA